MERLAPRTFQLPVDRLAEGVPVDVYGDGSWLLRGENDFTADIVEVEGRACAKVGRRRLPNPRLQPVA